MGRALLFHGSQQPFELAVTTAPPLGPGELLVRILTCTICRSDLHSHAGRRHVPTPSILGHEIVGKIEAFGPETSTVDFTGQSAAIGDRITWSIVVGCGNCYFCREGLPQKCVALFKYGHEAVSPRHPLGGGLADYAILVPRTSWMRLPETIPNSVAALANCAGATAAAALRTGGAVENRRVLVLGAGILGMFACSMARSSGAAQVVAVDPQRVCRERALAFGADVALNAAQENLSAELVAATEGLGFDVALELAGVTPSVATALAAVRTGGTAVLVGSVAYCDPLAIDPEQIVRRMLTIRGVHNYLPGDLQAAVDFLDRQGQRYPFESLVIESYPLSEAEAAFRSAHSHPGERVAVNCAD
jgi:putative phosphonate catabolism associated alcohol dehydrogenase